MKSILITGCNRGLGLGLVKNLLITKTPPEKLIATCRDVGKAAELKKIAENNKNVHLIEIDLTNFENYPKIYEKVNEIVGENGLNVLFNNAGVSPKSTRIKFVKPEQLMETYRVNTVAPILLTKTLHPLLKRAALINPQEKGINKAMVLNMTSILGSIASNREGGLYPYRCSKTALNMATKSLSIDLKSDGILAISIHPGWVKTDLGGANAPLDVDTSTQTLIETIRNFGDENSGKCYQYDGKLLEW